MRDVLGFKNIGITVALSLVVYQNCGRIGGSAIAAQEPTAAVSYAAYPSLTAADVFGELPQGSDSFATLCANPGQDVVSKAFCVNDRPSITSLKDLMAALGLSFVNTSRTGTNGRGGNPAFVLTGHSSSLVAKDVSAINPRAIIFTPNVNSPGTPYVALSYTRGEQFAEIATTDASTGELNFYLVKFSQACTATRTCTPGDLLTPAVERNWTDVAIYEDDPNLTNTILDCRQCHQPKASSTGPMLRMQEIQSPYTHFFWSASEGGRVLISDFINAHGKNEDYAGVPANLISKSDPSLLARFVTGAGFGDQPNAFPSAVIEAEVEASNPRQPMNNSIPGTSPTWELLYSNFVQGQMIAPPYHDVKVADPAKLASMTAAYQSYRNASLPAMNLPDIRNVLPDEVSYLSEMGFRAQPGLDAKSLFVNACMQCHNSNLDQSLSRARFNVENLDQMNSAEKNIVVDRLSLPADNLYAMPPQRFRALSDDERQLMIKYMNNN